MTSRFRDRAEAGKRLATRLVARSIGAPVVLGLPRGGVPVAFEVAAALHAPLDVILVRKLGVPGQPELALGAVGEDGVRVLDEDVLRLTQVSGTDLDAVESRERREVVRRSRDYRVSARRRAPWWTYRAHRRRRHGDRLDDAGGLLGRPRATARHGS